MKKLIFISITVLFLLNSCKKELESISLNRTNISMHYDESEQLEVSYSPSDLEVPPEFSWFTDDAKIAEIDQDGIVYGVKVGETMVYVETIDKKFQASCKVEITPISNLYRTPVIEMGQSKSYIKSKETRVLSDEKTDAIAYEGENSRVRTVMYLFEYGKLDGVGVLLANEVYVAEEALIYLDERYDYLFVNGGVRYYLTPDEKVAIGISVDDTLGLVVMYIENPGLKSTDSLISEFNRLKKQLIDK